MYRVVTGVTSDIGVPSTYLVYFIAFLLPGLEYVLMQNGTCHVRILNKDINVGNWNDIKLNETSLQLTMRHGNGFFDLDSALFKYQGKVSYSI